MLRQKHPKMCQPPAATAMPTYQYLNAHLFALATVVCCYELQLYLVWTTMIQWRASDGWLKGGEKNDSYTCMVKMEMSRECPFHTCKMKMEKFITSRELTSKEVIHLIMAK